MVETRFRRGARWAVPATVAVAAAGLLAANALSADATSDLQPRTAAQLLADVANARVGALSGTVVQRADLGLPALPNPGGGRGSADLASLVSGSHTLRVWYDGDERFRLALLGTLGESDVIRNGPDLWVWSSTEGKATHYRAPAGDRRPPALPPGAPATPREAAERALAAVTPTTQVRTAGTISVAGRDAYELVLEPKDTRSLIGSVKIAVDGRTYLPLCVRVYARGAAKPAFEVGFTRVSFTKPGPEQFRFVPPPGTKVTEVPPGAGKDGPVGRAGSHAGPGAAKPDGTGPTVVGTGWTRIVVFRGVDTRQVAGRDGAQLATVLRSLPRVSGSWGSGRLLTSSVFSALLTDDGRLLAGPVPPDALYAAAGRR
jgi:outer membrane lipoprotein-sorting protein